MFAVDVCKLPTTGGSTEVIVSGFVLLLAGVVIARWVHASAGRLSAVVAPLLLFGGLVSVPQGASCPNSSPTSTSATTMVSTTTSTIPATTLTPTTTSTLATTTTTTLPPGTTFTNRTTTNGLGANRVRGVFSTSSTIYAATNGGLSISTNGGDTFTNRPTTNGLGANVISGVYTVENTVYAATNGGLSISTNLSLIHI